MVDANQPGTDAQVLRQSALAYATAGELTPESLAQLAGRCTGLLYDLIELPYDALDVDEVDRLRQVAMSAVELILNDRSRQGEG